MKANIYTVPPGRPFLDCLARAILAGDLPVMAKPCSAWTGGGPPRPLDLPAMTLMLPTRRATRALEEAFLRASGGRAMLLPKIVPIAEGAEDLSLIEAAVGAGGAGLGDADIPPAMSEMERRLALTELVLRWSEVMRGAGSGDREGLAPFAAAGAGSPAQAATLAAELARLMDMVETEGASLGRLAALVPETYSVHWQRTIEFLKIVTEYWPAHLAEIGFLSPAERRNRLILAEARRLEKHPPSAPVIVAGVTGSIPATAELMRAVLGLPNGAIVLPALDTALDDASWDAISPAGATRGHPEHPQFGLRKLLDRLGVERRDVAVLPGAETGAAEGARASFVSETLRPASTTDRWRTFAARAGEVVEAGAFKGLSLIEAPTAEAEAEAIALILREAAETPGRTAALVSPDRLLARRVVVRLEAWGLRVDDSAGRPFAKTAAGSFLDLLISAVAADFAPAELVALLKHPLTRLGLDPFAVRRAARALELAAFRQPYLGTGLAGVEQALERAALAGDGGRRPHPAVRRLWKEDWDGARDLVAQLKAATAPLTIAYETPVRRGLKELAAAHAAAAEAVAQLPLAEGAEQPSSPLWDGEAGESANRFFAGLLETSSGLAIAPGDYADLYRSLLQGEAVRPRVPVHPRLFIWGPFEARLQQPDVVVLGSLNDGTWPEAADPGPWLNRPMRLELGLPSPEEKIGLAAHDFATLLCAPEVVLTRAEKRDGVPTVPSRWLLRMKALTAGLGVDVALGERPQLGWALERDRAPRAPRLKAPAPRPAVGQRPRKLSVSRVEAWIKNPYDIFAREVLRLEPLDPLGLEPQPSLRGSLIHEALSRFAKAYPSRLPADVEGELARFAREALHEYAAHPRIAAFWIPRFERFAEWFADTEPKRREKARAIIAETSGSLVLDAPAGPFTLTARADRIDVTEEGLVITDYKTGKPPKENDVLSFAAPQLPLEAAIALYGVGFAEVPKEKVAGLRFISAAGGEPPGEECDIEFNDFDALAAQAVRGLSHRVARFDDPATPYRALRRPGFSYAFDAYAHLARVAEWSAETGSEEG